MRSVSLIVDFVVVIVKIKREKSCLIRLFKYVEKIRKLRLIVKSINLMYINMIIIFFLLKKIF